MKTVFRPALLSCTVEEYKADPIFNAEDFCVVAYNAETRKMMFFAHDNLDLLMDMFKWDCNGTIHKALTEEEELTLLRTCNLTVDEETLLLHLPFFKVQDYLDDGSDQYQDPV